MRTASCVSTERTGRPARLDEAIAAFAQNRPVIVVDQSEHAELCCAGDMITVATMAFLIAETSGLVVATVTPTAADRLNLPLMGYKPDIPAGRYCVAVDATDVATTGISASDRALTLRQLAAPSAQAADFTRPGHVIPALVGGPFAALLWTCYDAASTLSQHAGLSGVVACAAMIDGVDTAGPQSIQAFAEKYSIPVVNSADVVATRPLPSAHVGGTVGSLR